MNNIKIKAIDTKYKGYLFRSRLEARWAVFFDALGIKWEYEKEGYDLDGIYYLPDFWLPELKCFIEIKGEKPSEDETNKARRLSETFGFPVYIFFGEIPFPRCSMGNEDSDSAHYIAKGAWDCFYYFCECPNCHKIGIEYCGRAERINCGCNGKSEKHYNCNSERLMLAYQEAKSKRFEWGENGRRNS